LAICQLVVFGRRPVSIASALSVATVQRAELKETLLTTANDLAIRRALETAGVEFIDENGVGPGVRLRKRERPKRRAVGTSVPIVTALVDFLFF
jgi:hypothetical protein